MHDTENDLGRMDAHGDAFELLVQRIDPDYRLIHAWKLEGGVSAETTAIEVELPDGQTRTLVVRLHGEIDRSQNPEIAADEFRLLQTLHTAGIPVPEPCFLDRSRDIFPIPYLVAEYVDGSTELDPDDVKECARELARQLARIHQLDWRALGLSFLPDQTELATRKIANRPATLDRSLSEDRIRAALEPAWPPAQENATALLHGDYWPGNFLWKDGHLQAIIDWEDATLGDPLAEFGGARLELLWILGHGAMKSFTAEYLAANPSIDLASLPYWELYAALRHAGRLGSWGLDPDTEQGMLEHHRWFVNQSLRTLP